MDQRIDKAEYADERYEIVGGDMLRNITHLDSAAASSSVINISKSKTPSRFMP
jgi:hypothetical protein